MFKPISPVLKLRRCAHVIKNTNRFLASAGSAFLNMPKGALIVRIPHSAICLSLGISRCVIMSRAPSAAPLSMSTSSLFVRPHTILPSIRHVRDAKSAQRAFPRRVYLSSFRSIRPDVSTSWMSCQLRGKLITAWMIDPENANANTFVTSTVHLYP